MVLVPYRIASLVACIIRGPSNVTLVVRTRVTTTEEDGTPAVPPGKVDDDLRQAREVARTHGVALVELDRRTITAARPADGIRCHPRAILTPSFAWFSREAISRPGVITVFYVDAIGGPRGCSFPGTNWITIAPTGDGRTVLHEIGHLTDLWRHRRDPGNVMSTGGGGTRDQLTVLQRCLIATSRFASPRGSTPA